MDELVQRLSEGEHPVIAGRAESAEVLKESIDRGYVLIKFTETRGESNLGFTDVRGSVRTKHRC